MGDGTSDLWHTTFGVTPETTCCCCLEKWLPLPCGEQLSAWFWVSFTLKSRDLPP